MTVAGLKKKLDDKSKQELVQEISELYKKFPDVRSYYQAQYGDIEVVLEKYKDIIKKDFVDGYMKSVPKYRLSVARKAIRDFKKLSSDPCLLVDIMLTFVESVSDFNTELGPRGEDFYTIPEDLFESTLEQHFGQF